MNPSIRPRTMIRSVRHPYRWLAGMAAVALAALQLSCASAGLTPDSHAKAPASAGLRHE
jgi:hypothetical protein